MRSALPRPPWRVAVAVAVVTAAAFSAGVGGAAREARSAVAPTNTGPPTITGTAQQGQTLQASTGSWAGDPPVTYAFAWQRCNTGGVCASIAGATSQTYTLTAADVGSTMRVLVTGTNPTLGSSTAASSPTAVVTAPGTPPTPGRQPDPIGSAVVGQTLIPSDVPWSGTEPISFSYQWQRCSSAGAACTDLPGATGMSYVVVAADAGSRLRVVVRATNPAGSASIASNLSPTVSSTSGAPVAVGRPSISGNAAVGQTLLGNPGSWVGTQPIVLSYSWNRCEAAGTNCRGIPGAASANYRVVAADAGSRLQLVVRGSNTAGAAVASSPTTAVVTPGSLPAGAIQLPDGRVSIPASSVSAPERLVVSTVKFSPNPVRSRAPFTARFRITDTRGYVVRDALVYAIGLPYAWFGNAREVPTGADGYAVIPVSPTADLPVGRTGAAVFFVRARKGGDNVLTGVSTRRLVQVRLR